MAMISEAREVLNAIGEPGAYGGSPPLWNEAMSAMPDGAIPFLDLSALPARRAGSGLPAARDSLLRDMVVTLSADRALQCFAWYLHWRVFVAPEHGSPWGPPSLISRLGKQAGMLYELLALEFEPRLAAWHRRLGYPRSVTEQTVLQITSYEANHLRGRGGPGLYENQFVWLATYLTQPCVRLGRLEYQLHPYGGGVTVWRRTADGQVLALAEDGTRVADDGLRLAGDAPESSGWIARLEETPEDVTGFPVDPAGRIMRKRIRLDRTAWTQVLRKGMMVLDLHIPAGGGMTWEAITDSFRQAHAFFARHHADQPFAALAVTTWFMDPRLADLLPAEANPVRLQRAVYQYPTLPQPGSLWFVFLQDTATADPATLPRHTSFQRSLASFLDSGKKWHGGGMFLLPEDMLNPSEGLYRDRFQALRVALGLGGTC